MDSLTPLDGGVLIIVLLGMLRGAYIGMIRESFSIASLAVAVLAVKFGKEPASEWLQGVTNGQLGPDLAPWVAGILIVVVTIVTIAIIARALRRGVQVVGLGWVDRLGGGALGVAEGGLVAAIVVSLVIFALGEGHALLNKSQSVEAVETLQQFVSHELDIKLPDVAAEPR